MSVKLLSFFPTSHNRLIVHHKTPECFKWLRESGVAIINPTNKIVQLALAIKQRLGIVNDRYHPNRVGENDFFIVVTAAAHRAELLSNEARQQALPARAYQCKIPAVCKLDNVKVDCLSFVELIRRSKKIF